MSDGVQRRAVRGIFPGMPDTEENNDEVKPHGAEPDNETPQADMEIDDELLEHLDEVARQATQ